mmetsp:Transcript_30527/g.98362  ORF Transcript_30527/g.98362 Transcript_30527/m.98362 type:complete len:571 (+) Transcript_30527:806-2518(+)
MHDGVLLATAILGSSPQPVVVAFSRLGASWEQVDVITCEGCECRYGDYCFGSSLAVHNTMAVVGFPLNQSVLIYERRVIPSTDLEIHWLLKSVLTASPDDGLSNNFFGASIAMSGMFLVVGFPSTFDSGAKIFSLYGNQSSRFPFAAQIFDSRDHCCSIGLPCCYSAFVGVSVDASESPHVGYSKISTIAIGDPQSSQVHVLTCDGRLLEDGLSDPCDVTATVLPGYQRDDDRGRDGFGAQTAIGGEQAILVADANQGCEDQAWDSGCGTVCEVTSCSPGHCLMYDFSTDTDFCQKCSSPESCPGGIKSCTQGQSGTIWAMIMSTTFFFILFCCLYGLSAWARGASIFDVVNEICCCGLLSYFYDFDVVRRNLGEEPLLGSSNQQHAESSDDSDGEGYIPPSVRQAFRPRPEPQAPASDTPAASSEGSESQEAAATEEEKEGGSEEADGSREGSEPVNPPGEEAMPAEEQCDIHMGDQGDIMDAEGQEQRHGASRTGSEGDVPKEVGVSISYFSCKVCFDRRIQTVLIPCGHEALCKKCSKKIKVCPICRKEVKKVQVVISVCDDDEEEV